MTETRYAEVVAEGLAAEELEEFAEPNCFTTRGFADGVGAVIEATQGA